MDPKVKKENLNRMFKEGKEKALMLLKFVQDNLKNGTFTDKDKPKRTRKICKEYPEYESFIQVHPIVAQYIIMECVFDVKAFKKYVNAVFGYEKTREDMEFLAKDTRNIYYFKNKQYALYSKFLMREYNKHIDMSIINKAYNNMVDELNEETRTQFQSYDEKVKEMNILDSELTEEKRNEFVNFLQREYGIDMNTI